MGTVLVGIDGSATSELALGWAAQRARRRGDGLEVVMAWETPDAVVLDARQLDSFESDFATEARDRLEGSVTRVLGSDLSGVRTHLLEGHPVPVLMRMAANADLLVLGSSGHGEFSGMLLGSVSLYAAAHAPCPVVIVRDRGPKP